MNMEPEVPIKKLETMVKLDAVRRVGSVPAGEGHALHVTLPASLAASFSVLTARANGYILDCPGMQDCQCCLCLCMRACKCTSVWCASTRDRKSSNHVR